MKNIKLGLIPILGVLFSFFAITPSLALAGAAKEERHFTFQTAPNVMCEQVKFKNRFGIELCADLYKPYIQDGWY